jgi:Tfp pilus assembly protein PilF
MALRRPYRVIGHLYFYVGQVEQSIQAYRNALNTENENFQFNVNVYFDLIRCFN